EQVDAYQIKFSTGPLQGQERTILSNVGNNPAQIHPSAGDSIVTFLQRGDAPDSWDVYIEGFDRQNAIIWLVILFVATMILLAGWQGVKVALSIGISVGLIGYVLIPLFLAGWNPVPVAIILAGFFTVLSCGLSTGWDKKAMITALATIGGALVAYLLSVIFVNWSHLAGLSSEEDRLFFQKNPGLNPRGLLFAGIIIASAGVLEDVAVSIVSGISEVHRVNPRASFRDLFISGMAVGRDHMAALANTLIYAYVGGSLSSLLLYKQYGQSWLKFINFDSVVDEIVRSLCGTIGLVFTIPISAFLAASLISRSSWKDDSAPAHTHHGHSHGPHTRV
nr:YibE/F family protein [Patescibacteria group bacterium]